VITDFFSWRFHSFFLFFHCPLLRLCVFDLLSTMIVQADGFIPKPFPTIVFSLRYSECINLSLPLRFLTPFRAFFSPSDAFTLFFLRACILRSPIRISFSPSGGLTIVVTMSLVFQRCLNFPRLRSTLYVSIRPS